MAAIREFLAKLRSDESAPTNNHDFHIRSPCLSPPNPADHYDFSGPIGGSKSPAISDPHEERPGGPLPALSKRHPTAHTGAVPGPRSRLRQIRSQHYNPAPKDPGDPCSPTRVLTYSHPSAT